ncbi:MAG: hypothetical protein KDA80_03385 [Planctomycetaceae bacterium]|nr:hypothetical protein [Planctomycetaceae bacterium]
MLSATVLPAQDAKKPNAQMGPRPVAQNLDNPSGIAVHGETGHIFVAEHRGVLRLFKQEEKKGYSRKMQVARYPSDVYGKGPMYDIGPLGVALLGTDHLVVGDGSRPDGEELVRVYEIAVEAPEKPTPEKKAAFTLGPITAGDASAKGEGNYYGVAVTKDAIFATANGDDTKGWIVRAKLNNGKPGKLEPFIATKEAVSVDAPCAITVNAAGDLVVGQMGEISVPGDSLVCVYDPSTGKLKKSYETGLSDIVGLAYSPNGKLYAVDFSWIDTSKGALYELTMDGDKCSARKIVDLDKPTSLAFDTNGTLLVTVFGTAEEGSDKKPGKVLRIGKGMLK